MHQPDETSPSGAESAQARDFFESQVRRINNHDSLLQQLGEQQQMSAVLLQRLNTYIASVDEKLGILLPQNPIPPPAVNPPPAFSSREPDYRPAELFDGNKDNCGGFLLQCRLAITRSPSLFPDNFSKVTLVVNSLKGRALQWAHSFLQSHSLETLTYQCFVQEFRKVFEHPLQQEAAGKRLLSLRQGRKSVADHSISFRITAEETGWDDLALKTVFTNSLSDVLKDQLATREEPNSLDELITLAIRIDSRLQERRRERDYNSQRPNTSAFHSSPGMQSVEPVPPESGPEPMQLGRARLSLEERQRRLEARQCFYCGGSDHFVGQCTAPGKGRAHR